MNKQSPFLDISSFLTDELNYEENEHQVMVPSNSPFLSVYETEEGSGLSDPVGEDYVTFLNELYDEEFNEALTGLLNEASEIIETQFITENEDPQISGYNAERLLNQHFAPLITQAEEMFEALAREFNSRDLNTLTEGEIDNIIDNYHTSVELSPNFEEFWGKLKKTVKKVAKKAVSFAKKGIKVLATGGLSVILPKLKKLVKPLLKRVINSAIKKLPVSLQPIAKKLAQKLPFLKEYEDDSEQETES